jgi:hypothetical protein
MSSTKSIRTLKFHVLISVEFAGIAFTLLYVCLELKLLEWFFAQVGSKQTNDNIRLHEEQVSE